MTDTNETYRVTAKELRQFIERFERLEAEKKDLAEQQKEVMAESKSRGYTPANIKEVIRLRAMDPDKRAEAESITMMYREAVGV